MIKDDEKVQQIIKILTELEDDNTVPKNIKDKVKTVSSMLKGDGDIRIKVNKVLHELDDIADDPNLQPYTRTQIWNIVSMLEKVA